MTEDVFADPSPLYDDVVLLRPIAMEDVDSYCRSLVGEMIGDCELELREDGFVNVMYVVFADWRRRGVATRAVRLLAEHAARVFPGRPLLFRIHPDNEGSVRVATAAGAERAGTELSRNGRLLARWVVAATDR